MTCFMQRLAGGLFSVLIAVPALAVGHEAAAAAPEAKFASQLATFLEWFPGE